MIQPWSFYPHDKRTRDKTQREQSIKGSEESREKEQKQRVDLNTLITTREVPAVSLQPNDYHPLQS